MSEFLRVVSDGVANKIMLTIRVLLQKHNQELLDQPHSVCMCDLQMSQR